ncbi:peroxisome biogenesis protein 6 [Impatiens glandulifera]|uniref:peroxisome biogenesis protein 6 n=1 Tax=Impatiens glandulifera TaxID=253017 RepID=UPI001FB11C45|nr:peroxisome biogenesis protein 6 [Impatiens glandulifera]
MVEKRRKPLVLSSTKALINTVLSSAKTVREDGSGIDRKGPVLCSEGLQFPAGILLLLKEAKGSFQRTVSSLDDSILIGFPASVLKKLSITSGSMVHVKNVESGVQRIGQVVVLDPPELQDNLSERKLSVAQSSRVMLVFPSCNFPQIGCMPMEREIAYVSPLFAFNLSLHVSCLKYHIHQGRRNLESLFEDEADNEISGKYDEGPAIKLEIQHCAELPTYASHLRISFVKIPECGMLESLKGNSSFETKDRQNMVDLALHNYFEIDRCLSRDDVFSISINWNCNSSMCISCSQREHDGCFDTIYFKVVAMEPSDEPILRVNRTKTALVLGGSVRSSIPPDMLFPRMKGFAPLELDLVKKLACILAPSLCPSALSSKFRIAVLLSGLQGCGKRTVAKYVAHKLGLHVTEYNCHDLMIPADRKTSAALVDAFKTACKYSPTIFILRHFEVLRDLANPAGSPTDQVGLNSQIASVIKKFTMPNVETEGTWSEDDLTVNSQMKTAKKTCTYPVLLIATADSSEGLPPVIRRCFTHEISMGPLTEKQRNEMISQLLHGVKELLPDGESTELAKEINLQTSGFMPRDIRALIADTGAHLMHKHGTAFDKDDSASTSETLGLKAEHERKLHDEADFLLSKEHLTKAVERSKKRNASALGTPKVPNIKWEDVGGLEDVKKAILDTVQLPLLHKDLFSSGLRKRSGVLFYGPPGTGKTLLAKAVATECSLNFLSVKGPELINMYIGESEKNVRDIFQKARAARPCVIFFDELDSLAPARGASGDSGGVMDRVVSQMLAEIDGLNDSSQDLFIIGASNRPDLIDPALLRPGRFDKLLYVGVNTDTSYREHVLKALTRKFTLHEDVSLYDIAKKCPPNFTGADTYALCADAWFQAAKRKVLDPDSANIEDNTVIVEYDDFIKVLGELTPSLSLSELKKYEMLRDQFEGGGSSR